MVAVEMFPDFRCLSESREECLECCDDRLLKRLIVCVLKVREGEGEREGGREGGREGEGGREREGGREGERGGTRK